MVMDRRARPAGAIELAVEMISIDDGRSVRMETEGSEDRTVIKGKLCRSACMCGTPMQIGPIRLRNLKKSGEICERMNNEFRLIQDSRTAPLKPS